MSDLFRAAAHRRALESAPLAERLRPTEPAEFADVAGLLAPGAVLPAELAQGRLPSILLWGPPGCGKTSLARLLARASQGVLVELPATTTGVAGLRDAIEQAQERRGLEGCSTVLFVDEIHRLDRRQQDSLLAAMEQGVVVLIGASTENPGFHLTPALRSRCRLLELPPLDERAATTLLGRAAAKLDVTFDDLARASLLAHAAGDGRRLLNGAEHAAGSARAVGRNSVTQADVVAALGRAVGRHDRLGDGHFELLSALHKSLRGSDPQAAVYYLHRLLNAGEDPRVIVRRMVAMASEDVGLADPRALSMALDALRAVEFLGLPEGRLALTQAAIYLALAPRSDSVLQASDRARQAIESHGELPVPPALRNASTAVHRQRGDGAAYEHAHSSPEGVPGLEHLPNPLAGLRFYEPGERGAEVELARRLALIAERRARAFERRSRELPAD